MLACLAVIPAVAYYTFSFFPNTCVPCFTLTLFQQSETIDKCDFSSTLHSSIHMKRAWHSSLQKQTRIDFAKFHKKTTEKNIKISSLPMTSFPESTIALYRLVLPVVLALLVAALKTTFSSQSSVSAYNHSSLIDMAVTAKNASLKKNQNWYDSYALGFRVKGVKAVACHTN